MEEEEEGLTILIKGLCYRSVVDVSDQKQKKDNAQKSGIKFIFCGLSSTYYHETIMNFRRSWKIGSGKEEMVSSFLPYHDCLLHLLRGILHTNPHKSLLLILTLHLPRILLSMLPRMTSCLQQSCFER